MSNTSICHCEEIKVAGPSGLTLEQCRGGAARLTAPFHWPVARLEQNIPAGTSRSINWIMSANLYSKGGQMSCRQSSC
ncbi:hypothetical protein BsWGS_28955 [Bradybaena similaris]